MQMKLLLALKDKLFLNNQMNKDTEQKAQNDILKLNIKYKSKVDEKKISPEEERLKKLEDFIQNAPEKLYKKVLESGRKMNSIMKSNTASPHNEPKKNSITNFK